MRPPRSGFDPATLGPEDKHQNHETTAVGRNTSSMLCTYIAQLHTLVHPTAEITCTYLKRQL